MLFGLDSGGQLGRRSALQSMALQSVAGAAMGLSVGPTEAAQDPRLRIDLNDPKQNLRAFTRVFADTDPSKVAVGWYSGTAFAVIGDSKKLQPLLGIEGIGVRRTKELENGGYRVFNRELAFYKDLKTGTYLETWDNPLNGEKCEAFPIQNMFVNADTAPIFEFDMEGTKVRQPFNPPWSFASDWAMSLFEVHQSVKSELQPAEWPRESAGEFVRISEVFHRHCRIEDLNNEALTSVPTHGTWVRLASWFPWMLMGQTEGHLFFRCQTHKFDRIEDLPKEFLAKAERGYSQYLDAPSVDSWGKQPNDSTFGMYKRTRKPAPAKAGA